MKSNNRLRSLSVHKFLLHTIKTKHKVVNMKITYFISIYYLASITMSLSTVNLLKDEQAIVTGVVTILTPCLVGKVSQEKFYVVAINSVIP